MTFPLKLGLAASATALAAACAIPLEAETDRDSPVYCALHITEAHGQVSVSAVVEAREAVTGRYDLTLRQSNSGSRADLSQGGELSLAKGERSTLGQAQLSGRAGDIEAKLMLDVNGARILCPITD